MSLDQWATLLIAIAAVVPALAAIPPTAARKGLITVSAFLLMIAVVVAVIGSLRHPGDAVAGPIGASPPSETTTLPAASPTPSQQVSDASAPSPSPSSVQSAVSASEHPTGPPAGIPLAGPAAPDGTIIIGGGADLQSDDTGGVINGQTFANAFEGDCGMACTEPETVSLPLNLGRKYSILKARFGIDDKSLSASEPATITIIADGSIIYSRSFTLGHSSDVTLNISEVLRLTVQFSGDLHHVFPAVGDPTVYQ